MKKYIFVLIASLMAAAHVNAQTMTPQEEREFYQKAYAIMLEYAQTAAVNNASKAERFKNLFANPQMGIYNDLMSLSSSSELSVADYVKALSGASTVSVTVKNIRKGQISEQGPTWQLPVYFEKSISYVNSCGVYIDSYDYFQKDYVLFATVVMEKGSGRCYIGKVGKGNDSDMDFPEDYKVLVKSDKRDDKLTIDGRAVNFNRYDQVLLHPGYKIKYLGADVGETLADDKSCENKIRVSYLDKKFRLKLYTSFALGGFYSLSDAPDDLTSSSSDFGVGLDFGYIFPSSGKLSTGLFFGLGLSSSKLNLDLGDNSFSFQSHYDADIDNDSYDRHYSDVSGLSQTLKSTGLAIPIYADFEYRFAPAISVYADLGLKLQTSMSSSWSGEETKIGEVYGIYPQYGNLRLPGEGQTLDINGFGRNKSTNMVGDEDFKMSMGISGLLGLGLRANLGKSLAADLGIQYQAGLTNCWKNEDSPIATGSNPGALIRYDNDQELMEPLLNTISSMKQNALRLHIGLIFKF
ncbi:MAG: hypothetical protein J6E29_06810 [Prevotella sp.]|nr:hypothetical protein [Prevotella sp.]